MITWNIHYLDRFWMQVDKTESCWNWTGAKAWNGYGSMRLNGKRPRAHRVSWMLFKGALSANDLVLHRCDNPACVNPDHLYIGDQKQNAKDRDSRGRNGYSKRIECKHGHPLIPSNIYLYKGKRICRTCRGQKVPLPEAPTTNP